MPAYITPVASISADSIFHNAQLVYLDIMKTETTTSSSIIAVCELSELLPTFYPDISHRCNTYSRVLTYCPLRSVSRSAKSDT